jgi:GntR family transcriptional regulator / MocR family aminotransferase
LWYIDHTNPWRETMRFAFDRQSDIPLYQQIENYFRESILSGSLAPDTRLPAVRELARDLGINRITVEKAYAELEADGLIFSRVGSGTYVLAPSVHAPIPKEDTNAPWPLWQMDIQNRMEALNIEPGDEVFNPSQYPGLINFATGSGDSYLFPAEDFRKVIQTAMRRDGAAALEYGELKGFAPLRSTIAQVLSSQGIQTHPENILVTAGSQQALALVSNLLLKPGDVIFVESPTYSGALDLFRALNLKIIGVPMDDRGMQVEKLEKLIQQFHPSLIYTIPNFQNPTGTCMSTPRRRQLVALAERYNLPVLEDDFVGDLRYEGHSLPALKALDPGGRVIYVSSFSKMLMPGLRVGFLAAEGPVYDSLVNYKRVNDLVTSNLVQRALEAYMTVGRYQAHLHRCCMAYKKRRDAMLLAINRYLPAGVDVNSPQGGLYVWLHLPDALSSVKLFPLACIEGVSFVPGTSYFPDRLQGENYMRLNFVNRPPEEIDEGIRRLAKSIKRLAVQFY